jgi:hypothetical protein
VETNTTNSIHPKHTAHIKENSKTSGLNAIGDQITLHLIPGDQKPFHTFKCRFETSETTGVTRMLYVPHNAFAHVSSMTALKYEKRREISSLPQEGTKSVLPFHALQNALQN